MRHIALFIAKAAGTISRILRRGGGTSLPGMILMKIRPTMLREMAQDLEDGIIVISATNGKTTTARMVANAIQESETSYVANTSGANLASGIATALLAKNPEDRLGIFEVDEAVLPALIPELQPSVIVLMNLFRDRLDRYEFFGIEQSQYGRVTLPHAADSTHCQKCDSALQFQQTTIGHLGHWSCQNCGEQRPKPTFTGTNINLNELNGSEFTVLSESNSIDLKVPLAGLHNVYNALAAFSICSAKGIKSSNIQKGLSTLSAAFGRNEIIHYAGTEMMLLLAKNPAGANQNLQTLLLTEEKIDLVISLNDRTADGKDISWIWDVDYEMVFDRIATLTISGDRAYDLALRFYYSDFPTSSMNIVPSVEGLLNHLKDSCESLQRVVILPTYTAMLDLRSQLNKVGATHSFWEEQ